MVSKKNKLTQETLKKYLDYNPETGDFTWKEDFGPRAKKGFSAGCVNKYGYRIIRIGGRGFSAHRLAFIWMEGYSLENEVDHIDRDKLNNRWENLREASRSCNAINCKIRNTNTSGVKGVHWNNRDKRWVSRISVLGSRINIGNYLSLIEAVKAKWEAEKKYGYYNCNTTSSAWQYLKTRRTL